MASDMFNFSGLKNMYSAAWLANEPTIAFELKVGRGRFVFIIFFTPEEKEKSGELLFIHLRHVNSILNFKLYGSRKNGDFKVYIMPKYKSDMIAELQLSSGEGQFSFEKFLNEMNRSIPDSLSLQTKINTLRTVWPDVKGALSHYVDDADKTILMNIKKLDKNSKPRERTLRKLFTYTNSDARDIEDFITALKKCNYTLMWTNDPRKVRSLADLMKKI